MSDSIAPEESHQTPDEGPPSETKPYQDFADPNECNPLLPARVVTDEFFYGRFLRLEKEREGEVGPAVVPRDRVRPELVAKVLENLDPLEKEVALPLVWGGNPPFDDWCGGPKPNALPQRHFPVDVGSVDVDPGEVLRHREVTLDGDKYRLLLEPSDIAALGAGSPIIVPGENADGRRLIHVRPQTREGEGIRPLGGIRHRVSDLSSFLEDPSLSLPGGGRLTLPLKGGHITELRELGVTRFLLKTDEETDERMPVYVEIAPPSEGSLEMPSMMPIPTRPSLSTSVATASEGLARAREHEEQLAHTHAAPEAAGNSAIQEIDGRATVDLDRLRMNLSAAIGRELQLVLYLPYHQTWELLGYSRGDLLNSISLGPDEEATIEVFTWDRLKREREEASMLEREATLSLDLTTKITTDLVSEVTNNSQWGWNVNGDVSVPIKGVQLGFAGGVKDQQTVDKVNRSTQQVIGEAIRKATARIKTTRQSKVLETQELGRETRVTRKIKNTNKCRVLTFDYFAVDGSFRVTTTPLGDRARVCILTPNPINAPLGRGFLLCYEPELRQALEARDQGLADRMSPAFDAARRLAAADYYCDYRCKPKCPCDTPTAAPANVDSTGDSTTATKATDFREAAIADARARVASAAQQIRAAIGVVDSAKLGPICNVALRSLNIFNPPAESEWVAPKLEYRRYLYRELVMESVALPFWSQCRDFRASGDSSPEALDRVLRAGDVDLGDILNVATMWLRLGPKTIELLGDQIANLCLNPIPLFDPRNLGFDDGGLGTAFDSGRAALAEFRTASAPPSPAPAAAPPDAGGAEAAAKAQAVAAEAAAPFAPEDLAADAAQVDGLICNLEHNESYYRHSIWSQLDSADRFRYLSLALGDELSRMVDMEVLGYIGDKVALPVVDGALPELDDWMSGVLPKLDATEESMAPLTVPTGSVVATGRLDACDLCEPFIVNHRRLDLEQKAAEVAAARERTQQEELETRRRRMRLDAKPKPLLDDPDSGDGDGALRVVLEDETRTGFEDEHG